MIEWAVIATAVAPHVKKYVSEKAGKLAKDYAETKAAEIYKSFKPDERLLKATESFVTRFNKELDSAADLPTLTIPAYEQALKTLLADPEVLDALEKPLDGESEFDWDFFSRRWRSLRTKQNGPLIALPEDFDWPRLAKRYRESLEKQTLSDPALREVWNALKLKKIEENTARAAGPARPFDLDRYAESVREAYKFLKLGPLDPDWALYENRIPLENVFVPQIVKPALPPRDITRDYRKSLEERGHKLPAGNEEELRRQEKAGYAELAASPVLQVVDDPARERIVVLGDPGLGKSTLLKYLALRWAEDRRRPLALLVELRRAVPGTGSPDFLNYLEHGIQQTFALSGIELDHHLREQPSLVMFDGLDEVAEAHRPGAVAAIINFGRLYPKARIIVTTRIYGYHPGSAHPEQFRDAGFDQFTLQDFSDPEIAQFIGAWHATAFQKPEERNRYEAQIRKAIAESPAIHELAGNPLLLTMMAMLNRVQDLPRDRCKLYERCAELLLRNWDLDKFPEKKDRREARDFKDKIGPDQKMRILEQVAAAVQQERTGVEGNLISQTKLTAVIEAQLVELDVERPKLVADDMIWMLRERNFMLAYLGDRQYAFVHRTFLEYFCAREIQYRLEKTAELSVEALVQLFRERWSKDEWREALCLLCGLIGPDRAGQCISALLGCEKEKNGPEAIFLAARCLLEIRELGLVRDVRTGVREALLRLMKFDFPFFYELWDHERLEVGRIREEAVRALAVGWAGEEGTWKLVRERAIQDEGVGVRIAALQELARGRGGEEGTWKLVRERAIQDENGVVRSAALRELARGRGGEEGTWKLVRERAADDESQKVRELAQGYLDRLQERLDRKS